MSLEKLKSKTNLSKYEWLVYSRAFLKMADIGMEEFKGKKYVKRGLDDYFHYDKYKYLLIPIIWNFKHAIELVVKTLGVAIDKQYLKNHDLTVLKNDLKQLLRELKIKKQEKFEDLAEIIDKYYRCEFWDKKIIRTGTILDVDNDIFRYPENKAPFFFDWQILKDIPLVALKNGTRYSRETEELSDDIKKLESLLVILDNQIEHSKFIKKK